MRGRSSKQGNCKGERMEIDNKLDKLKEEPQLSGAYIRSLVKQLTSSRTKDPMNPKGHQDSSPVLDGDDKFPAQNQNLTKISETQQPQPPQQPQQHKKQGRCIMYVNKKYIGLGITYLNTFGVFTWDVLNYCCPINNVIFIL